MTAEKTQAEMFVADGATLFLLGNGPSLKEIDLRALAGRDTLGMNAAYRYWREIGWFPAYYACLDTVVGLSHKDAIGEMIAAAAENGIRRFLLRENLIDALGETALDPRIVNFDALRAGDASLQADPITTGSHAALWAARVGYRKIVLLGVDGRYREIVTGAEKRGGIELEIVEAGPNPNYFFDTYQRAGDRYNIPNPRPGLHVEAWAGAARRLAADGVMTVNGNERSEVRFFPFAPAKALAETGRAEMNRAGVAPVPPARPAAGGGMFFQRQRAPLAAGVVLSLAAALAARAGGASFLAIAAGLGLFYALLALVLHARNAASDHIAKLSGRISELEALANHARREQILRERAALASERRLALPESETGREPGNAF